MIDRKEYSHLSLNDIGEMVRIEGKLVARKEFFEEEISLYFMEGEVVEVRLSTVNGGVQGVDRVWDNHIDPFLKYLETSTKN